eukprot:TRINITY_DN207_c0_g1_i1.p1 TRINITY_DN207_c0_g1~~TRINITY_DN207_c0_g1_i1.p1  ORF type:complete len:233 (-),score=55.87 TRINITY_DN207_c0_g1_i1:284-982(-)
MDFYNRFLHTQLRLYKEYVPESRHHPIHNVIGGVFQGNSDSALMKTCLEYHDIKAVVNVTTDINNEFEKDGIEYLKIEVYDCMSEAKKLERALEEASSFINKHQELNNNVLVHCHAGISRSSTITLSYLMKYHEMTFKEAYEHLQSKREIICPNEGFCKVLIDFEYKLYSRNTLEISKNTFTSHFCGNPYIEPIKKTKNSNKQAKITNYYNDLNLVINKEEEFIENNNNNNN